MQRTQVVRCPNCGSWAERHYFTSAQAIYQKCPCQQITQTECSACDYLMAICSITGQVIEAHSPGICAPVAEAPAQTFQVVQRTQSASQPQQVAI